MQGSPRAYTARAILLLALLQVLLVPAGLVSYGQSGLEVDASCIVTRVIDGDTFSCIISEVYSAGLGGLGPGMEARVRLADINAPELRPEPEPGAVDATSMLSSLLRNGTVYLDVDDVYVFDRYGRIVAVVLAPYNDSHLVNVNLMLVYRGLAEVWEHDNEWIISETPLYAPTSLIPGHTSINDADSGDDNTTAMSDPIGSGERSTSPSLDPGDEYSDKPDLGVIAVVILLALFMLAASRR